MKMMIERIQLFLLQRDASLIFLHFSCLFCEHHHRLGCRVNWESRKDLKVSMKDSRDCSSAMWGYMMVTLVDSWAN